MHHPSVWNQTGRSAPHSPIWAAHDPNPERWPPRTHLHHDPRYEAMTDWFARTCAGEPEASTRPEAITTTVSASGMRKCMLWSTTMIPIPSASRTRRIACGEDSGFGGVHADCRFVEEEKGGGAVLKAMAIIARRWAAHRSGSARAVERSVEVERFGDLVLGEVGNRTGACRAHRVRGACTDGSVHRRKRARRLEHPQPDTGAHGIARATPWIVSSPSSTVHEVGGIVPASTPSSVVLPEPLGPISPRIARPSRAKSRHRRRRRHRRSAWLTSRVSNAFMMGRPR